MSGHLLGAHEWERIVGWLLSEDTGASSECMLRAFLGKPATRLPGGHTPRDHHDFGRCYRMLRSTGLSKAEVLRAVTEAHPDLWGPMSERWEELEDLYSKGLMNQVYDALQEINWSCRGCCKRVNYMRAYLCNDCFEVRS